MNHRNLVSVAKATHYFFGLCLVIFLLIPLFAMIPLSFSSGSFLSYPIPELSLRWYEEVFSSGPWMDALQNSLIIGVLSTLLATTLGTLAAFALARRNLPAQRTVLGFLIAPMIIPPVITGLGMYFLFGRMGLTASMHGLVIAHTVLATPFVVITVTATLQGFDMRLLQAANSLGASPFRAFFNVVLPLILPGVVSGGLFAFVASFDEIIVTLFLGGPAQRTIPRQMFDGIRDSINPSIIAMSVFLMVVALLTLLFSAWLNQRSQKNSIKE